MGIEHAGKIQAPAGKTTKKGLHKLALGIECIGLVSLRFPLAVAFVAILLVIAAGFGVTRLKVDNSSEPIVSFQHTRIQAIRGSNSAISVERIRCARRH